MGESQLVDGTARTSVVCTVCPQLKGKLRTMMRRHIQSHCNTAVHIRHLLMKRSGRISVSKNPFPPESRRPTQTTDCESDIDSDASDMVADCHDDAYNKPTTSISAPVEEEMPLSTLWDIALDHHVYEIGGGRELFNELEASLLEGDKIIATPIAALEDEIGMQDDDYFGIELLDEIPVDSSMKTKANMKVNPGDAYYPWLSKAHFLTALLFSSARLPFSDVQKKAVLSWAKELGAHDVPSLKAVKESNEHICELVGNPMRKVTSASGNDYANPLTRFSMQDYPEDGGDGMSQECSGGFFVPERFFTASYAPVNGRDSQDSCQENKTYAMGRAVQYTDAGFIVSDEQEIVPVSNFRHSFEDLVDKLACGVTSKYMFELQATLLSIILVSSEKYLKLTPHPLREKSKGRMVYSVPLIIFMDDVSGNVSKQWNKHHAIYMSNANLPREMLEKEFCVRFVTSSPHAAPMELMHAMKESISAAADSGIFAWDCKFDEEVMLVPEGLFLAGDNPMQAEECSHAGLNCNYFCRTCHVGGTKEYKESEAGYVSLFTEGTPRTPEETTSQVLKQFETALCSGATGKVVAAVSTTGIRDSTSSSIINTLVEMGKKLRKRDVGQPALPESEVRAKLEEELLDILQGRTHRDAINPLLGMNNINVHMDTPTEILHTVLLGVVKYFWGQTAFVLEKAKLLTRFQTRGLIGKHFKSLAQVMPFVVYDLVPKSVLDGWTLIGELVVLIWHTKIDNTEHYLAKLARTISDFLNVTAHRLIMYSVLHAFTTIDELQVATRTGRIIVTDQSKHEAVLWQATRCADIFKKNGLKSPPSSEYYQGTSVVTSEHETSQLGGHVIFRDALEKTRIGRIREILIATAPGHSVAFVALQTFSFMPARHPLLHLPCLLLTDEELIVSGTDIICIANHLCSLLPESLSETPLRVSDPGAVRRAAVRQMQGKRLAKKLGGEAVSVPQDDDGVRPAFDCAAKKQPKTTSRKQVKSTNSTKQQQPVPSFSISSGHIAHCTPLEGPPKMMLNRFPLRSTSGGSQRANSIGPGPRVQGLAPPRDGRHRARSLLGSDAGLSTHSAPVVRRQPTSSGSQSQSLNPLPDASIVLTGPSRPGSPSGSSDLNAPISAGVRRRRDSSTNAACLTPRRTKRLKTYAQQLATERGIPLKKLLAFIEFHLNFTKNELRAGQLEREEGIEINTLQELEKLLTSKDFESALKSRLTACMLSPNLTAYITDTHQHVMVVRIYFLLP
ncbi:uncharacterized protein F5891DRAFT_1124569 [Suillus fuscotomentosus]|uniref:Uncharacterized protein n=1 Tax=Suillus fuscotomentosus TaxID=1912939 RepID=A0AAD4EK62_9AGAM|nr:uncharacterized protein F5891DRAFT_1124569 [Suillus fuscotomentosus]KAG1907705.1 hypothetical protein F5891DRAFT_1124569 [Suillus fuscotomentosus]